MHVLHSMQGHTSGFPAHPKVDAIKIIELIFLSPKTTSKTEPMDQVVDDDSFKSLAAKLEEF